MVFIFSSKFSRKFYAYFSFCCLDKIGYLIKALLHKLSYVDPPFFATSPKACNGVWKDSCNRRTSISLPLPMIMVIPGIIIKCMGKSGIGFMLTFKLHGTYIKQFHGGMPNLIDKTQYEASEEDFLQS